MGIATKDALDGESLDVLTHGYVTARRTQGTGTPQYVRDITPMLPLEMGTTLGGITYPALDPPGGVSDSYDNPHIVLLAGTLNVKDDGGKSDLLLPDNELEPNGNYSDNKKYAAVFDAGVGKTIQMKVNNFQFESGSSTIYDHLKIEWSDNGTSWSPLASRKLTQNGIVELAPDISKYLLWVDSYNPNGNVSSLDIPEDIGGKDNNGAVPVTASIGQAQEAYVFPGSTSSQNVELSLWRNITVSYTHLTLPTIE